MVIDNWPKSQGGVITKNMAKFLLDKKTKDRINKIADIA